MVSFVRGPAARVQQSPVCGQGPLSRPALSPAMGCVKEGTAPGCLGARFCASFLVCLPGGAGPVPGVSSGA